jgi:tetratricopeptide (TPR) repeat protein
LAEVPALVARLGTDATTLGDRLAGAVQEAIAWGLLSPISPEVPNLLSIQPTLPFFLRSKLAGWDEAARVGLREAFKRHYLQIARDCYRFINAREIQTQKIGIQICHAHYENLAYCLKLYLENMEELFMDIYACLSSYLNSTENREERLRLSQSVYEYLEMNNTEGTTEQFKFNVLTVYDVIAGEYTQDRRFKDARFAYERILNFLRGSTILPKEKQQQLIAAKLQCLGDISTGELEFDDAKRKYNEALNIFLNIKDILSQIGLYHQLGILEQLQSTENNDSHFKSALIFYQKSARLAQKKGSLNQPALVLSQVGTLYQDAEMFEDAKPHYLKALHIFDQTRDKSSQAKTYRQLGATEQSQNNIKEARDYYQNSLGLFIELGDRYHSAFVYHQLGILARELNNLEEARCNYKKALQIFMDFNDLRGQAITYCTLGNVSMSLEDWQDSCVSHLEALKIWLNISDEHSVRKYSLVNIQRLYQQTQDETLLTAAAQLLNTTPDDLRQMFTT